MANSTSSFAIWVVISAIAFAESLLTKAAKYREKIRDWGLGIFKLTLARTMCWQGLKSSS